MKIEYTEKDLKLFSKNVAKRFEDKQISGPIHLCGGNEKQLIEIFKRIDKDDWVFSTHRNSYHALLKGINIDYLNELIDDGRCMHVFSKYHNFFTSAIVGGCCAISVGVAKALKLEGSLRRVWCFVGDGAVDTGRFYEAWRYTVCHNLPLTFVVEDNGMSVETPIKERWNATMKLPPNHITMYKYRRKYPHTGSGKWVSF